MDMSEELKNVVVLPTSHPVALPPHPDSLAVPLSGSDYLAAKNLRILYQLIYQICPGGHGHYASFPDDQDSLPGNYSAKVCCTGDGTSWRVVIGPERIKGMVWYFCGLKRLEGMFKTAVIRYWNAEQCEAFVEALESGGIQNLPSDWRFAPQVYEAAGGSEDITVNFAALSVGQQGESGTATGAGNGCNVTEVEGEKSTGSF